MIFMILRYLLSSLFTAGSPNAGEYFVPALGKPTVKRGRTTNYVKTWNKIGLINPGFNFELYTNILYKYFQKSNSLAMQRSIFQSAIGVAFKLQIKALEIMFCEYFCMYNMESLALLTSDTITFFF